MLKSSLHLNGYIGCTVHSLNVFTVNSKFQTWQTAFREDLASITLSVSSAFIF